MYDDAFVSGWPVMLIAAGLFGAFYLAVALNDRLASRLSERAVRVSIVVGSLTYPLYLLHENIGYIFIGWLVDAGVSRHLAPPLVVVAAVAGAYAMATWYEPAARRAIRGAWARGRARLLPAT